MGFEIKSNPNLRFELVLKEEPDYCHALEMSIEKREPELNHGNWMIMNFAVWSTPDRDAISTALNTAKEFEGKIKLGIRPFDDHRELLVWCNGINEKFGSPIWLFLKEGKKLEEVVGLQPKEDLKRILSTMLEDT